MTLSKQETQELIRKVQDGHYVTKATLYVSVVLALLIGLYVGNLLTTLYGPAPAAQQSAAGSSAPQSGSTAIDPAVTARILKYEKSTRDTPSNVEAWISLGHAYFDGNRPKAAIEAYTQALALQPDNPDVLTDMGVMYRRDGQPERALEQFAKAIAADPRHEQAHFNSGIVLYHDLGRKEEALEFWRTLVRINPKAKAPNGTPVTEMIKDHAN